MVILINILTFSNKIHLLAICGICLVEYTSYFVQLYENKKAQKSFVSVKQTQKNRDLYLTKKYYVSTSASLYKKTHKILKSKSLFILKRRNTRKIIIIE